VVVAATVGAQIARTTPRFHEYWFRPSGHYSIAISRIALFVAVYFAYTQGASSIVSAATVDHYFNSVSAAAYNPTGIVRLIFPTKVPPVWVVEFAIFLGKWATLAAIVGLFTRASMIASILSVLFLISLQESWRGFWSHGYVVVMLAGLAFMFGRAGDCLSVDSFVQRFFGKSRQTKTHDGQYWWPVLLAQAAVALFYFGGFYAKWSGPDWSFTLDWIFSDNLRHSLAFPWNHRGLEMPWYVSLVTSHAWLWQLVAAGHFLNQLLPLMAVFNSRRPWVRLVEGGIFAIGVALLGIFMNLWNGPWFLMVTFFVDWDYFINLAKEKLKGPGHLDNMRIVSPLVIPPAIAVGAPTYAIVFLTFYVATILFKLGDNHLMYPFSSMAFYSNVKALEPYNEHRHYPFYGGQVTVLIDGREVELQVPTNFTGCFRTAFATGNLENRVSCLKAIVFSLENSPMISRGERDQIPEPVNEYRVYTSLFHLPAYPASPIREVAHRGLVAVSVDGNIYAAHGRISSSEIDVATSGFKNPKVSLLGRINPRENAKAPDLVAIPGTWNGFTFRIESPVAEPFFSIIRVEENGHVFDFYGPEFVR
jgi:hypothetical protein